MKIKNDVIQKTLDVIPTKDFFRDMVTFIKHPEIYDGENEYVPLKNAGANFFKSLIVITAIITLIKWLMLDSSAVADFNSIVNPLALQAILTVHALTAAAIFWATLSAVTYFTKRETHYVYFLQVIQTWAVMNVLALALSWMAFNRLIENGTTNIAINNFDLSLGGILGASYFYLLYRLIFKPVFIHLRPKFSAFNSLLIVITGLMIALLSIIYIPTGLSGYLVNRKSLCIIIYEKNINPKKDNPINKAMFLSRCIDK
ncbi:hypothetical protein SD435_03180 [Kosakonia cowanii]|uniref:hypothetical protein n=1 Tax=Kosakonia cowanii TaxID=208223 RepID=UPI0029C8B5B4|nr:hypothetical protein [Kosakonia cowanii]WPG21505.1 hypothetical protein SD435_03180 [Kosakonia cowanii]